MTAVGIYLSRPEIPSCHDCQRWLYSTGWKRSERSGKPLPRPNGSPLPCNTCPKAFKGRPNPAADMKGRNWGAYALWLAVRAGQPMPDDPIVHRNCALIQMVSDHIAAQRTDNTPLVRGLLGR